MSSRPQISSYTVVSAGNMASNITSPVTIIDKLSMVSYSYSWSGTSPSGTVFVDFSNDYQQTPTGVVIGTPTWNQAPLSNSTTVSGNTGTGFIDMDGCSAYAVRTRYVANSGTGTMTITLNSKVT